MTARDRTMTHLTRIVRLRKRLRLARRVGRGIVWGIGWVAVVAVVDRVVPLPPWARLINLAAMAGAVWWRGMIGPALVRNDDEATAAAWTERVVPALDGRLSAVAAGRASGALIEAVAGETLARLPMRSVARTLRRRLAIELSAAGAAAALLLLAVTVEPLQVPRLLVRQFNPLGPTEPATSTRLTVESGSFEAADERPVVLRARTRGGDGRAVAWVGAAGETPEPVAMNPTGDETFEATLPPTDRPLVYRVHAGDAVSRLYTVSVPKRVGPRSLTVFADGTATELLGQTPTLRRNRPHRLRLIADEPLAHATLETATGRVFFKLDADGRAGEAEFVPAFDGGGVVRMNGRSGATGRVVVGWRVRDDEAVPPADEPLGGGETRLFLDAVKRARQSQGKVP